MLSFSQAQAGAEATLLTSYEIKLLGPPAFILLKLYLEADS
jgi:hypothetical protein